MKLPEAIKIVKEYKDWRDNIILNQDVIGEVPVGLGIAIDIVIKYCEEQIKESAKFEKLVDECEKFTGVSEKDIRPNLYDYIMQNGSTLLKNRVKCIEKEWLRLHGEINGYLKYIQKSGLVKVQGIGKATANEFIRLRDEYLKL